MMLTIVHEQTPVPPPAYHRAQVRLGPALHIDALTLVNTLQQPGFVPPGSAPGPSSVSSSPSNWARWRTAHLQ